MSERLKFVSENTLLKLVGGISENLERYRVGDFIDLSSDIGWQVDTSTVSVNLDKLAELIYVKGSVDEDLKNSILVYEALDGMTPAIAMDERVWVRLTHIECLEYSRKRWLRIEEQEKLEGDIAKHMFASGRDKIRDDNAISRLWWNMHIASIIEPSDPKGALEMMLLTSDYRMAFVERPLTSARLPVARAIVRSLQKKSWIAERKDNFLRFMVELNRDAGGVLFEALSEADADKMIESCMDKAQKHLEGRKS